MGRRESERRPKERAASDLRLRVSCHSTPGFIIQRVVVSLTGSSPAWQGIPITPPDTRLPGAHDSSRQNASPGNDAVGGLAATVFFVQNLAGGSGYRGAPSGPWLATPNETFARPTGGKLGVPRGARNRRFG